MGSRMLFSLCATSGGRGNVKEANQSGVERFYLHYLHDPLDFESDEGNDVSATPAAFRAQGMALARGRRLVDELGEGAVGRVSGHFQAPFIIQS
jgi:hypothetical protein